MFSAGSDGTSSAPGHVGIYLGAGRYIDAPYTGAAVRVENVPGDATYGRVPGLTMDAGTDGSVSATPAPQSSGGTGCTAKGEIFSVVGLSFSFCQAKAILGGLCVGVGGGIMLSGTMIVVAWGLGHTGAGKAAAGVVRGGGPVGMVAKAVR